MDEVLLIGVDGGATEAKAHAVACDDLRRPSSFELRAESASRVYARVADFAPLPVAEQLVQREAGDIKRTDREIEQGRLYVQAAAEAVIEVAQQCAAKRVLVGIGMPGLKTPDGRGINTINNGPRMPDYLDLLEKHIAAAGVELVSPVAALGSDADYCGLGEEYAAEGLFRDVESAYYVGCGTGIADALKLRGKLLPFDHAKSWIQKSWQIASALGPTFEKLVSANSLNRVYADLIGATKRPSDEATEGSEPEAQARASGNCGTARGAVAHGEFPEAAAAAGDPVAGTWMGTVALVLAELIFERIWTVKNGRAETPDRGAAYAGLEANHEYRGTLLERVIIGQRVGQIYGDAAFYGVFGARLDCCLAALIAECGDVEMTERFLKPAGKSSRTPSLKADSVQASRLRAAPALGAAVAAVQALGLANV